MVIKKILVQSEEPEYTGVLWAKLNGDSIDLKLYRGNKWISVPENKFTPEQIAQIIGAVSEQITPEDLGTLSRYQIQALLNTKANVSAIPTKVSDLDNDNEFITTETDPTVPSHVKSITQTNIDTWSNKQDTISDLTSIRNGASLGSTAYQKPSTGIPKTDLSQEVQNALDNPSITSETDPVFTASPAYNITSSNISSWNAKQNALTFDTTPTANSTNPVTSAGIKAYVDNATPTITMDDTPTSGSNNPVKSNGVYTALQGKVSANTSITGATKTKITYDSKGLVTAGADLSASDIPSLTLSKISDVTATASELNVLDGITATTTELNYTDGVTGNIQTQLDSKANQSTTYTKTEVDALLDDVACLGDDDGQATTLDFDPQADTVWNIPQTLGSSQQAQARANIGVVDVSGTNDGTNWTSLTIGSTTKAIPSGGGGGGETNVIESISINGTTQTVTNKNVDLPVPTSSTITAIVSLTEAQYTALVTKDSSTLYVIIES